MMEEYLSNSSIHGLVHIHNAKSGASKAAWVVIVTAGFVSAAILISNAYGAWVESPVSTVVTIRPISDLQFPEVTVCPPRGSNTILNQVLKKITDEEFTPGVREHLKAVIHKMFFFDPSQAFAKSMAPLMNLWSSKDIQGRNIHFPERTANSIHFQVNISDMASLKIEGGGILKYSWQKEKFKLYTDRGDMTFVDAEDFCVNLGGHLASVQSKEENLELLKAAGSSRVWLGGSDQGVEETWLWTDKRTWNFTNWSHGEPDNVNDSDCAYVENDEHWHDTSCSSRGTWPLCRVEPKTLEAVQEIDLLGRKLLFCTFGWISGPRIFLIMKAWVLVLR